MTKQVRVDPSRLTYILISYLHRCFDCWEGVRKWATNVVGKSRGRLTRSARCALRMTSLLCTRGILCGVPPWLSTITNWKQKLGTVVSPYQPYDLSTKEYYVPLCAVDFHAKQHIKITTKKGMGLPCNHPGVFFFSFLFKTKAFIHPSIQAAWWSHAARIHQCAINAVKTQANPLQLPYLSTLSNVTSQQESWQTQRHVTASDNTNTSTKTYKPGLNNKDCLIARGK